MTIVFDYLPLTEVFKSDYINVDSINVKVHIDFLTENRTDKFIWQKKKILNENYLTFENIRKRTENFQTKILSSKFFHSFQSKKYKKKKLKN